MILLMNIIVLGIEMLYYALFMKFVHKKGKIWKYLMLFTLINMFFLIVGTNEVYSYLLLILLILFGLKYIVKLKVSLYDVLIIFIMLLSKLLIELPFYTILINFISNFGVILISGIFKIIILFLLRNKLEYYYDKLKITWNNNNFYIRYIFTIAMFIYTIASCVFLIVKFL